MNENGQNERPPLVGEVIAIGDELTTGQRLDTNTQWLSQRLTEAGVRVVFHTTVADQIAANVDVFRAAAARADVAVSTGGLGPTADDLTRDAMAEAAGAALFEDARLLDHIEALFRSRGRQMPPQNRRQAQLPEGADAIPNPGGTAPGVDLTIGRCRFFALPGVPAEMREMWNATVQPAVQAAVGVQRTTRHWIVRCFGAGESHIESLVPELIARGREPLVGITASKGTISLRITASGADPDACYAAMEDSLAEIRAQLGAYIFAEHASEADEVTLADAVVPMLRERGLTVATSERLTDGLLAHWLATADTEGDAVAACSVDRGAAAPETVAEQLVSGANADCGVVVGHLGDDRTVDIAVALADTGGRVRVESRTIKLVGHPSIHRDWAAKSALNLLRLELDS